jgi:hypothetical protein
MAIKNSFILRAITKRKEMKGLKRILLLIILFAASLTTYAQPVVDGTVRDVDTQLVIGQFVEIFTDTSGTPYPYYDTVRSNTYGRYSFTLPNNIPQGVVFKVRTQNCGTPIVNSFQFPFNSIACDFTICATNKYISGTVYRDTNYADQAIAYLIRRRWDNTNNTHTLLKIDSLVLNSVGGYNFKLPVTGNDSFLVKAALLPADTANYIHFLPAYYSGGALQWNNAAIIPKQNISADITLPQDYPMQGQGYIAGTVLEGANKSASVGDSLYKRILILTTINDVPVAYSYSDIDGTFSFTGLDYGSYKLFGDALGKNNPPLYLSLSSGSSSLTDIIFEEDSTSFAGLLWPLSINSAAMYRLKVYPNPASDHVIVSGLEEIAGDKKIFMYNVTGSLIHSDVAQGKDSIVIPVADLTPGLYMLHIHTKNGNYIYKIVR